MSSTGRGVKSETEAYSSESDAKLASSSTAPTNSGTKKRPSRAGTRSVTSLSAAQLERKRANDREAQRAIRQRTKEHIEKLEKRIEELQVSGDRDELIKRVKELEEENAFLRSKMDHGGMHMNMGESPGVYPPIPPLSYFINHYIEDGSCNRTTNFGTLQARPGQKLQTCARRLVRKMFR